MSDVVVGASAGNISHESATFTLSGSSGIVQDGTTSTVWFEYRKDGASDWVKVGEGTALWDSGELLYTHSQDGLDADDDYELRATVVALGEDNVSPIHTFSTDPEPVGESVTTLSPTDVLERSAKLRLSYSTDIGGVVYFQWNEVDGAGWNETEKVSVGVGSDIISEDLTGLKSDTEYRLRGVLVTDTSYEGDTIEFKTLEVVSHEKLHGLGESDNHNPALLQDLNVMIVDANLDDKDDERDPKDHDIIDKHTTTETDTDKVLRPDGVDGVVWGDAPSNGGFDIRSDDPGDPDEGDVWFNTTDSQFKGYNGTEVVILG